jgi:excisionase family DNA binding protein
MQNNTTLSIAEVVRILGIGRSTLYAIIKEGRLPVRKIGRRSLILREDFDRFIATLPVKGE